MKIFTQADFETLTRDDDGFLYLSSGDWSKVNFNYADTLAFANNCELGDDCELGKWCILSVGCSLENGKVQNCNRRRLRSRRMLV
uniref:Bacterial transferase hexapeptide n=1 Tax=Siphoviridae sp. ctzyE57 TaxID=2827982 RepID=A0A8S5SHM4_9CAUD|nr:MAG TPA: Bacterial transferase hexapeptide [Siphoviridae sp. ctzyE57]